MHHGPQRISKVFFWLTLSLTILLTLFYLLVSDRWALGECVTIWPSFFWILLLLPLALASWRREARRRFLLLLIALALFLMFTTSWLHLLRPASRKKIRAFEELRAKADPSPGAPRPLRIATWNINGASSGEKKILEALASWAPDLCFFQETPDGPDHFTTATLTGRWQGFQWLDSGDCGLLSRFPMQALPSAKVGPWSDPQIMLIHLSQGDRLLVVNVRLMLPLLATELLAFTHFAPLRSDHDVRTGQFPALRELIATRMREHHARAAILAGDFNTPGGMHSLSPLRNGMRDAWSAAGSGWGATMTAEFPVSRIDQCWVTSAIRPVAARVLPGTLSDHRALVVDLMIE